MKPLAIALSLVRRGLLWGDGRGKLNNVEIKVFGNWHNEPPIYNEYMLIKRKK
jgi:hypothetical protein